MINKVSTLPYFSLTNISVKNNIYFYKVTRPPQRNLEAPDPVVKDLISYKIMKRFIAKKKTSKQFYKTSRLIQSTETTVFVNPIFRKA